MNAELSKAFTAAYSHIASYQRDGYVVLKSVIPSVLLIEIQADLATILNAWGDNLDAKLARMNETDKPGLYQFHQATNNLTSIRALNPVFRKIVNGLGEKRSPAFEIASGYLLGLPKDQRLIYNWHQESNYMEGFRDIYNFHYPIFGHADKTNGAMSVLVGSHVLGKLPKHKARLSPDSYTDLIPENIDQIAKEYPEVHLELSPGDVAVFHKDLIHRSNFNPSDSCRIIGISRMTQSIDGQWTPKSPEEL